MGSISLEIVSEKALEIDVLRKDCIRDIIRPNTSGLEFGVNYNELFDMARQYEWGFNFIARKTGMSPYKIIMLDEYIQDMNLMGVVCAFLEIQDFNERVSNYPFMFEEYVDIAVDFSDIHGLSVTDLIRLVELIDTPICELTITVIVNEEFYQDMIDNEEQMEIEAGLSDLDGFTYCKIENNKVVSFVMKDGPMPKEELQRLAKLNLKYINPQNVKASDEEFELGETQLSDEELEELLKGIDEFFAAEEEKEERV